MAPDRQGSGLRRLRWLLWNPVWVLIALAWLALIIWAMRSRFVEDELRRRQALEQTSPGPAR